MTILQHNQFYDQCLRYYADGGCCAATEAQHDRPAGNFSHKDSVSGGRCDLCSVCVVREKLWTNSDLCKLDEFNLFVMLPLSLQLAVRL